MDNMNQESHSATGSYDLETLTNNIQAAVIRCELNYPFTVTYANDEFFRMLGYSREQFLQERQNRLGRLIHPDDLDAMIADIQQQLTRGNRTSSVYRLLRREGTDLWILAKGTAISQPGGLSEFYGVLSDISIQKSREEELLLSKKRYEVAMNFSGVTMYDYNIATRQMILYGNDPANYNLPQVIEDSVETLIKTGFVQPESVADFRELYRKIEAGVPTAKATVFINDVLGNEGVFELVLTNIFDSKGKPTVAVGIKRDITHTFRLEREQQYSRTLMYNQLLIYEVNVTRDRVLSCNADWAAEYNITGIVSFQALKDAMCDKAIDPDFCAMLADRLSPDAITQAYESGQRLISLEYRKQIADGECLWFRKNVNIIKDILSGDIIIRAYIANINEEKIREIKAAEEQQHYETMVAKSLSAFTVNLTQNILISGQDQIPDTLQLKVTDNYTKMLNQMAEKIIHPENRTYFARMLSRVNLLDAYLSGQRELILEYRRVSNSRYLWVQATVHIFEDPHTGNVKAFIYEEDINESKLKALELAYKSEHDLLTGLYNKAAIEKHISDYLSSQEGESGKHAFFFLDVDSFKQVNDNFGHSFGDTVLAQTAEKLRDLFRDADIVGRAGGDEFIVLMKNIINGKTALSKAQEMCDRVVNIFAKDGEAHAITISVGIALYSEHGTTYEALYRKSDTALYASKKNGRNRYTMYNRHMAPMDSSINEIDSRRWEPNLSTQAFSVTNIPLSIINGLSSCAYVCDPVSYSILFANDQTRKLAPDTMVGNCCYETIRGQKSPCPDCPMHMLIKENLSTCSMEMVDSKLGEVVHATASWIDWTGGEKVCLINTIDIMPYKK